MKPLTLVNSKVRDRAIQLIRCAPVGWRVIIAEPRRSLDQNAKLHAMIDDWARQVQHYGRTLSVRTWKVIFLRELDIEREIVPSLNGDELISVGRSTAELSKAEMSELIELILAEGAKRGVVWGTEERAA